MSQKTKSQTEVCKITIGGTYYHSRLGEVTVVDLDEKNGETVAVLSMGEWVYASELSR